MRPAGVVRILRRWPDQHPPRWNLSRADPGSDCLRVLCVRIARRRRVTRTGEMDRAHGASGRHHRPGAKDGPWTGRPQPQPQYDVPTGGRQMERAGMSPKMARVTLEAVLTQVDILSSVHVPTLVLHRNERRRRPLPRRSGSQTLRNEVAFDQAASGLLGL